MNLYGEGESTAGQVEVILIYTIPSNSALLLDSVIFWGDAPAEFLIYVNGEVVGGARTSNHTRTQQVNYIEPIAFNGGTELIVTAEHYTTGLKNFKVNLIGRRV